MADFNKELPRLLTHEGYKANDPNDKGGLTYYGISARSYPDFQKNPTKAGAIAIYRKDFWQQVNGDGIADRDIAGSMVDFALTSGYRRANITAQSVLACEFHQVIKIDGWVGPKTIAMINAVDHREFLDHYTIQRVNFYCGLVIRDHTQSEFLESWLKRSADYL